MIKRSKFLVIFSLLLLITLFSGRVFALHLKHDDRGKQVEEVQQLLSQLGYDIDIDGIFGYGTTETIKDFQRNNGLLVDGIVGDKTYELLKKFARDIKYTVKKGDNLTRISRKYNTTIEDIKEYNNLNSDKIIIGQTLNIPRTGIGGGQEEKIYSSIVHGVQRGDALSVLARKYGTDVETIKLANNLRNDMIFVGQDLVIPHLTRAANQPFRLNKGSMIWPVIGRISSGYGYRTHPIKHDREFHDGLDIAVKLGTKIRAAAGGVVIQSGWINGFGKTIVIDHGQGVKTLYGHNSRLYVSAGEKVSIGQVISAAGSTGLSTGSHLHFGLYVNEQVINPLKYLP